MYVTEKFVLFYSNLFGFEKKIKVPYTHLVSVERTNTAAVIPNAIVLRTAKNEYTFRSFWDREESLRCVVECYEQVCALHNKPPTAVQHLLMGDGFRAAALAPAAVVSTATNACSNAGSNAGSDALARGLNSVESSAPSMAPMANLASSMVAHSIKSAIGSGGRSSSVSNSSNISSSNSESRNSSNSLLIHSPSRSSSSGNGIKVLTSPAPAADSPAQSSSSLQTGDRDDSSGERPSSLYQSVSNAAVQEERSRVATADDIEEDEEEIAGGETRGVEAVGAREALAAACAGHQFKYTGAVARFPCSLSEFCTAFIATKTSLPPGKHPEENGANGSASSSSSGGETSRFGPASLLSIDAFHTVKGDSEVSAEEWAPLDDNTDDGADDRAVSSYCRSFRFRTPIVGSPIGPSSTRAVKTQRWTSYGAHGTVVDTVTELEDIPYGDCFEVLDRWVVRPVQSGNNGTSIEAPGAGKNEVELTITFEIKWMKSCMWKRTIEMKTKSDTEKFFARCVATMQDKLRMAQTLTQSIDSANTNNGDGSSTAVAAVSAVTAASTAASAVAESPQSVVVDDGVGKSSADSPGQRGFGPLWLPWLLSLLLVALAVWAAARNERTLQALQLLQSASSLPLSPSQADSSGSCSGSSRDEKDSAMMADLTAEVAALRAAVSQLQGLLGNATASNNYDVSSS
jgi:hypothetical protein